MQRYIKKIGYKQEVKRLMLTALTIQITNTKRINIQKMVIIQSIKQLTNHVIKIISPTVSSIYKSLT